MALGMGWGTVRSKRNESLDKHNTKERKDEATD
jgi:hypothetical protein